MTQPDLYKLEGKKRESGKKASDDLRNNLLIPSVLYGPKLKENIHFSISEADIEKILSVSQTKLQELTIEGKTYKTLLKNVEFDPVTDRVLHADFYVLDDETPVKLTIPIRRAGTAKGVTEGGRVFQPLRSLRIKVLPERIPAEFEVDITHLNIGDSIHVSDLDMDGIEPLDDPQRTIVTIAPPKSESLFKSSAEVEAELEEEEVSEGEEAEAAAEGGEGESSAQEGEEDTKE